MDKQHYVYLLQHKTMDMNYIGVRTCTGRVDQDDYMGSSRSMTNAEKSQCRKIILGRFATRVEAVSYEIELHNRFDVVNSPNFWNNAKQTSTGFDTTGRVMSEEEKVKRSKALKGHKGATTWKGKKLPKSTCKKISESSKGKPKSEAHKEALRKSHKSRVYKGYDSTIYKFSHPTHGIVSCTQYELYTTYSDIQKSNLSRVISKERSTHKKWSIIW